MTPIETTVLQTTAKTAEGLLGRLLGPSADIYGQMLASGAQMQFLKNQIKNFKKVQKIVDDDNINIKQINLKVLFPYLNGVALEEDETLQDMWANLLVNYIDASKLLIETVYPNIISQLSTQNIEIINYMAKNDGKLEMNPTEHLEKVEKSVESLPNLIRLGIVVQVRVQPKLPLGTIKAPTINDLTLPDIRGDKPTGFILTAFGWNFLKACSR